jgi:hypothetical protein
MTSYKNKWVGGVDIRDDRPVVGILKEEGNTKAVIQGPSGTRYDVYTNSLHSVRVEEKYKQDAIRLGVE